MTITRVDYSPLRYPGSKRKLVRHLRRILEFNSLKPDIVVEPFVGGGSISLNLLWSGLANRAVIADIDPLITSFWQVATRESSHLISFVERVELSKEKFDEFKKVAATCEKHDQMTLAQACLYLNRTSFSGILTQRAGPLGGKNQKSKYTIGCRFNRSALVERLRRVAQIGDKITVLTSDWRQTLEYCLDGYPGSRMFFYLDPPFYSKAEQLYRYYFASHQDHIDLSKILLKLRHPWILSYDRATAISRLYSDFIKGSLAFPYSINSPARRIEREFLITSHCIRRPPKSFLSK